MNAWLLTWEGTDLRITQDRMLIAILSSRRSFSSVEYLADVLYLRNYGTGHDMRYLANRKKQKFYACTRTANGGFVVGNNPFVYGRQVSELKVIIDKTTNMETVSWKEPASYRQVPEQNYAIEMVDGGEYRSLVRSATVTIANDLGCHVDA